MITADEANSSLDPYNEMLEKLLNEFSGKATSLGSCEGKLENGESQFLIDLWCFKATCAPA